MDIRKERHAMKMTQREFSKMLGVSKRAVENWEGGQRRVSEPVKKLIQMIRRNGKYVP